MKTLETYYIDEQGKFYEPKEKQFTGMWFYEVEYVPEKGFVRTENTVFISNSNIKTHHFKQKSEKEN